jgi:inositol polyphosphate 5-phosphatase INPP5B/F
MARHRHTNSESSLMQDVPGTFPVQAPSEAEGQEESSFLTLSQAVHARRAEYVRPKNIRLKIGTWNTGAFKGTEKDVGGWFVEGKGVSEDLSGLTIQDENNHQQAVPSKSSSEEREDVEAQEARYQRKQQTLPKNDLGSLPGDEEVSLYVLGLQEVVDITSATEALRPYTDPAVAAKWKETVSSALPKNYSLVAEQQLIGLLLLVYASPDLAPEVRSISTTSVGTGLMGYMGNKGAVTARLVIGDTTRLVFVNCHMAAGADKAMLDRRNWDASQIVQRTKFEPIRDAMDLQQTTGEQIGDEDFAFWVGDLNYRLEGIPGDDVRRLLMLHTRNQYDLSQQAAKKIDKEIQSATESVKQRVDRGSSISSTSTTSVNSVRSQDSTEMGTKSTAASTLVDEISASDDPTSLQTTLSSLLPHDELQQQMKARKAFHDGWQEGPITFLPTYKYDVGSVGVFDSSEKKRAPSWCDRILFRTRRDKLAYEAKVKEEDNARKKDEEMQASGTDLAGEDEEILYDYDPDADGTNLNFDDFDEYDDMEDGVVITKEGFEDELRLESYTAHQRVLSSDHKPLSAIFTLKYDAVVPELKAKVHAEVAKELDKAENEGRPNVTVVVDQHNDTQTEQCEDDHKSFEGVWFGDVRWGQAKHRSLTVANTSRVPASFTFIERPIGAGQAAGIAPSWLNLRMNEASLPSSSSGTPATTLEPGDTVSVELEIRIWDMGMVRKLNEGMKTLDDILVLRVEGGRDHFIPIRGNWLDTSLGSTIDKLVRVPEGGIRKLQSQRPDSSKNGSTNNSSASTPVPDDPVRFSAPRELFRLTEAVEESVTRVVAEWDMTSADSKVEASWTLRSGWPFDEHSWSERGRAEWDEALSNACNALDSDLPLDASLPQALPRMQRLYIFSCMLILLLENMPDGVISTTLWDQIDSFFSENEKAKRKLTVEEQRTAVQEILSQSPSHSISFILITTMLERIAQEIAGTTAGKDDPPASPTRKPPGPFRRVTGSIGRLSAAPHTEQACEAWARIFGRVLVRHSHPGGKKANTSQERRQLELMLVFLRKDEGG